MIHDKKIYLLSNIIVLSIFALLLLLLIIFNMNGPIHNIISPFFNFFTFFAILLLLLFPSFFYKNSDAASIGKFCALLFSIIMTILFLILNVLSCMDICSTNFIANIVKWFFYFYLATTLWLLSWAMVFLFKKIFKSKVSLL